MAGTNQAQDMSMSSLGPEQDQDSDHWQAGCYDRTRVSRSSRARIKPWQAQVQGRDRVAHGQDKARVGPEKWVEQCLVRTG